MGIEVNPSVGRSKKCGIEGCVCTRELLPITAICDPQSKEHPKNVHSKPSKQFTQEFPVYLHLDLTSLKRLSRKYPKVYGFVKERKNA
jgi:hypothetical protein